MRNSFVRGRNVYPSSPQISLPARTNPGIFTCQFIPSRHFRSRLIHFRIASPRLSYPLRICIRSAHLLAALTVTLRLECLMFLFVIFPQTAIPWLHFIYPIPIAMVVRVTIGSCQHVAIAQGPGEWLRACSLAATTAGQFAGERSSGRI